MEWGKTGHFSLGYNKIKAKKEAKELATINEDTFIAVMEFGRTYARFRVRLRAALGTERIYGLAELPAAVWK